MQNLKKVRKEKISVLMNQNKINKMKKKIEKLNKKKFNLEKNENEDWGYQQIVIFDYEIKNR